MGKYIYVTSVYLFMRYIYRVDDGGDPASVEDAKRALTTLLPPLAPVVFAFTVQRAGRKCLEYYKTWRGNKVRKLCLHFSARINSERLTDESSSKDEDPREESSDTQRGQVSEFVDV